MQVYDDTGSVVPEAEVSLISEAFYVSTTPDGSTQEYNNVIQGKTDSAGAAASARCRRATTGPWSSRPATSRSRANVRVEAGTEPQPLGAILVTELVEVSFKVTPTTIQDQYDVTLQITYATNLTKPTLYAWPSPVGLSFFPEETQSGVITHHQHQQQRAGARPGDELGGARCDDNEVELVFADGSKVIKLPDLGPSETVQVPWTARIAGAKPQLNTRNAGNITVSGKYTYSIDGEALEGTTTTPIPVTFTRPRDLRLPAWCSSTTSATAISRTWSTRARRIGWLSPATGT